MVTVYDQLWRAASAQATVYDADGSHPRRVPLVVSDAPSMRTIRDSGDYATAMVPPGAQIDASAVVNVVAGGSGVLTTGSWWVVRKALSESPLLSFAPPVAVQLKGLPYTLTRLRASAAQRQAARDPWGGLTTTEEGATADSAVIRVGFSNAFVAEDQGEEGPLPHTSTQTVYTPLSGLVRLGDTVILPDGRASVVQDASALYADGVAWTLQLVLGLSGGSGLVAPSS